MKRLENLELLKQLYTIYSPSREEKKMRKFIKRWIRRNVPGAFVESDALGNIYVTKGVSESYPCQVCHIDEVHDRRNGLLLLVGDDIIAGRNPVTYKPEGIGADDKNGIYVALMLLKKHDVAKCAFFVGEEIGCVGSSAANMKFFEDVRFVLECDRKGYMDFVDEIGGTELSSEEWRTAIGLEQFGYKAHYGGLTDVATLKENGLGVCCANMSCGYYNPHTPEEVTILSELQNCYELCDHIWSTMTDVYKHEYVYRSTWYSRGTTYRVYSGYGGYDSYSKGGAYGDWYDRYYSGDLGGSCFNSKEDEVRQEMEYSRNEMEAEMEDHMLKMLDILDFDLDQFVIDYGEFWPLLTRRDYDDVYQMLSGASWEAVKKVKELTDKQPA